MNFKIICKERNGYQIPYTLKTFAGGELNVRLGKFPVNFTIAEVETVVIDGIIKSSDMLMELLLLTSALLNNVKNPSKLYLIGDLHYMPYARQDRVCNVGEAFSVEVFAGVLNTAGFDSVIFDNIHSDAAKEVVFEQVDFTLEERRMSELLSAGKHLGDNPDLVLVAPDKGATEKVMELSLDIQRPVCFYLKARNPLTGEITNTTFAGSQTDLTGKHCLIVDDIVDGGRTFIPIVKDLLKRGAKQVDLYATHAILPYGVDALTEAGISVIYCNNLLNGSLIGESRVCVL